MTIPSSLKLPQLKHSLGFFVLLPLFSVCLTVASFAILPPIQAVRWETDLNAAVARAEREQRPLFLHFVGNESTNALQTGSEVFSQPNIATHLNANFVMVRVNAVENPALAQRFAIERIPTDLIMRANGQQIHRRSGVISTERFAEYLVWLQNTIQADKNQAFSTASQPTPPSASPFAAVNPPSSPQPTLQPSAPFPGTVSPLAAPPVATAQPPVSNNVAPLGNFREPFGQPLLNTPQPSLAGAAMPPTPTNNPLRTESAVRPVLEQSTASVPPIPDTTQSLPEEPAPAKQVIEVPLALEGFCPILLCTEENWVSGNPAYSTMYQGHIFRFSSYEALVTFAQNPANYTPVAMGEDIVLRVDRNRRVNGDRRYGAWFRGRIFLFSSQETYNAFESRPDYYAEIALKYEVARREQSVTVY